MREITADFTPSIQKNGFQIGDFKQDNHVLAFLSAVREGAARGYGVKERWAALETYLSPFEKSIKQWGKRHLTPSFDEVVCGLGYYRQTDYELSSKF